MRPARHARGAGVPGKGGPGAQSLHATEARLVECDQLYCPAFANGNEAVFSRQRELLDYWHGLTYDGRITC